MFNAQDDHNSKAKTRLCGEEKKEASNKKKQARLRKQYSQGRSAKRRFQLALCMLENTMALRLGTL